MRELQRRLEEDKVLVQFPDSYIHEGRPFSFRGFTHGFAPGHFKYSNAPTRYRHGKLPKSSENCYYC